MSKDVETDYIIPEPYAEEGTIWGGTFKLRNVIEGVLGAGIFIMVVLMFPLGIKATALLSTILGIPMLVLGTVGLNNGPLSEFIVDAFRYIKSPRVYEYKTLTALEPDDEPAPVPTSKPKRKSKRSSARAAKASPKESDDTLTEPDGTLVKSSGEAQLAVEKDTEPIEDECDIPAGFFQMEEVSTFSNEEVEIEQEPEQGQRTREDSGLRKEDKIRMLELELEILKKKLEMEE